MRRLKVEDYIGKRFGRLTVISSDSFNRKGWMVFCSCRCGVKKSITLANLKSGKTSSCGCLNREITLSRSTEHGMSKRPIHRIWSAMIERCYSSSCKAFKNYGGRGIVVDDRWKEFANFYADMGERPSGSSLDRIDNNGPYSPSNCRWADRKTQNRNRRDNRLITISGQTRGLADWCEVYGQDYKRAYQRIFARGWDPKDALESGAHPRSNFRPKP